MAASCFVYAGHARRSGVKVLGGGDGTNHNPKPTASPRGGWKGRRRRNRDPRDPNRVGGGAARASLHAKVKPVAIKRPSRKCGEGVLAYSLEACRDVGFTEAVARPWSARGGRSPSSSQQRP